MRLIFSSDLLRNSGHSADVLSSKVAHAIDGSQVQKEDPERDQDDP